MITFECPQCGTRYEAEDDWLGAKVECATCSARFYVPRPGESVRMAPPKHSIEQMTEDASITQSTSPSSADNKIVISFDDIPTSTASAPVTESRKLSPRQRRLMADSQMMHQRFSTFPYIHLVEAIGNPPEKYIVDYFVKGIERIEGENLIFRHNHRAEIKLPGTYPRTPPTCRMLTPIFHPNIEPAVICIGDHWTAGERLCDLVVRIGEIITYQSYNIKSPLDGEAAMWADLHENILPIDKSDLMPPEE